MKGKASALIINALLILVALVFGYASISFKCPPGTKTVASPTSFEKWCVED